MLKTTDAPAHTKAHSKFQSLIGMLKTNSYCFRFNFWNLFQSLIGMLKTWARPTMWTPPHWVSIPHRYAENQLLFPWWTPIIWFQSLIGMLKTTTTITYNTVSPKFQSLIGMLKTNSVSQKDSIIFVFQSLIGMLKTYCIRYIRANQFQSFNPS